MNKPHVLIFDSYLAAIKGLLNSRIFQHLYAFHEGRKENIVRGGRLSCALVVSSVMRVARETVAPNRDFDTGNVGKAFRLHPDPEAVSLQDDPRPVQRFPAILFRRNIADKYPLH